MTMKIIEMLKDDKGKFGLKRVLAFMLGITAIFVILWTEFTKPANFDWTSTCLLLTTIFGCMTLLLGIGAKEKQDILKNLPK